jgi:transposase-like protein
MEIAVLRNCEREFEPKIVPKHQRERHCFDDKTLPVYGQSLPTKAVQENLKDIYNSGVPPELKSHVTDEIKGLAEEWWTRPLEPFPLFFFDVLRINIRDEGRINKKAVYPALVRVLDGNYERAEKLWSTGLSHRGGRRADRISRCYKHCFS